MSNLTDTPLGRTIAETATDIWNDSCAVDELEYGAPSPTAERARSVTEIRFGRRR